MVRQTRSCIWSFADYKTLLYVNDCWCFLHCWLALAPVVACSDRRFAADAGAQSNCYQRYLLVCHRFIIAWNLDFTDLHIPISVEHFQPKFNFVEFRLDLLLAAQKAPQGLEDWCQPLERPLGPWARPHPRNLSFVELPGPPPSRFMLAPRLELLQGLPLPCRLARPRCSRLSLHQIASSGNHPGLHRSSAICRSQTMPLHSRPSPAASSAPQPQPQLLGGILDAQQTRVSVIKSYPCQPLFYFAEFNCFELFILG